MSWRLRRTFSKRACAVRRVIGRSSTRKTKARPSRRQRALGDPHRGVRQLSAMTLPAPSELDLSYSFTLTVSYYVLAILAGGSCVQDRTVAFAPVTVG